MSIVEQIIARNLGRTRVEEAEDFAKYFMDDDADKTIVRMVNDGVIVGPKVVSALKIDEQKIKISYFQQLGLRPREVAHLL